MQGYILPSPPSAGCPCTCAGPAADPRYGGAVISGFTKINPHAYLGGMLKALDFCLPTTAKVVSDSPDWLHEVKYDGYRLLLERDGDRVRSME